MTFSHVYVFYVNAVTEYYLPFCCNKIFDNPYDDIRWSNVGN